MAETKQPKRINQVPLRQAETREEQLLLGFLHQEAERINWGQIVVEFTVQGGVVVRVKSQEISRTFNLGNQSS